MKLFSRYYSVNCLKIFDGSRRMVNGDYSHPIDTKRMRGPFREHADHMNNIGQGISRAVDEQMKSERFKTELITNVSHDLSLIHI